MRRCKFKIYQNGWIEGEGMFHQWGLDYEEFQMGGCGFTVGIVEMDNGKVVMPIAYNIEFIDSANNNNDYGIMKL